MHKNNLVHRDLKTENVVYSANQDTTSVEDLGDISLIQLKLIDFGFSRVSV